MRHADDYKVIAGAKITDSVISYLEMHANGQAHEDKCDFNAYDYSGGNFDDAYELGHDDGETIFARELICILNETVTPDHVGPTKHEKEISAFLDVLDSLGHRPFASSGDGCVKCSPSECEVMKLLKKYGRC